MIFPSLAFYFLWFPMIINEFLIWFLCGSPRSFSHRKVKTFVLQDNNKKNRSKEQKKKINRLAIRLIWCYSPIICFEYIEFISYLKLIKNSVRLVTEYFFFVELPVITLGWGKTNRHEKLARVFNNSLIIYRFFFCLTFSQD